MFFFIPLLLEFYKLFVAFFHADTVVVEVDASVVVDLTQETSMGRDLVWFVVSKGAATWGQGKIN